MGLLRRIERRKDRTESLAWDRVGAFLKKALGDQLTPAQAIAVCLEHAAALAIEGGLTEAEFTVSATNAFTATRREIAEEEALEKEEAEGE